MRRLVPHIGLSMAALWLGIASARDSEQLCEILIVAQDMHSLRRGNVGHDSFSRWQSNPGSIGQHRAYSICFAAGDRRPSFGTEPENSLWSSISSRAIL